MNIDEVIYRIQAMIQMLEDAKTEIMKLQEEARQLITAANMAFDEIFRQIEKEKNNESTV